MRCLQCNAYKSKKNPSYRRRPVPTRLTANALSLLARKRHMRRIDFNSELVEILVGPALRRDDELISFCVVRVAACVGLGLRLDDQLKFCTWLVLAGFLLAPLPPPGEGDQGEQSGQREDAGEHGRDFDAACDEGLAVFQAEPAGTGKHARIGEHRDARQIDG